MNAVEFLVQEHNHVRASLETIDNSESIAAKKSHFTQLAQELIRHETMEHALWYPHVLKIRKLDDTVSHLLKEEKHAERAIKKMNAITDANEWMTQFEKFKQDVEQHAEEEECKLFPIVKSILSEPELNRIGDQMMAYKSAFEK